MASEQEHRIASEAKILLAADNAKIAKAVDGLKGCFGFLAIKLCNGVADEQARRQKDHECN